MARAFHFVPIKTEDQLKACVNTPWGLYKFQRMAFGLKNAPASFQAFAEEVLADIEDIYIYLDDVLVFSPDHQSHQKTVREIFARFSKYGLVLSLSKCKFAAKEVEFLGYKVNSSGIKPLPNKISGVVNMPEPLTQKQLLKFLGMLNFYRKTLPNIQKDGQTLTPAEILQPLYTAATRKFQNKNQFPSYYSENNLTKSFSDAKKLLENCVTLTYPNNANLLALSCDASALAVGAVLEEYQDGAWVPLGYWSRHLNSAQQKWSCFRRELLAIVAGLRNFMPDIYGRDFIIYTDHRSILGAMASPNFQTNDLVATRQLLEISQYSHDIRYKPGKFNVTADTLSRPSNVKPGDAYCPEVDQIAAIKQLITTQLTPQNIYNEQAKSKDVENHILGKKSPKIKNKNSTLQRL